MLKSATYLGTEDENGKVHVFKKLSAKKPRRSNFSICESQSSIELARNEEMTKIDYRMLHCLIGNMDYGNNVFVTNKYLSDFFGMPPSYISLSIKSLIQNGMIMKAKIKGMNCFHVNEHVSHRGGVQNAN